MAEREQLSFGVDLGGTSTRVGLYDSAMELLASAAIATRVSAGPQSCVEEIAEVIRSVGQQGGSRGMENTLGIGIGSPGPINLRTGVLGLLPNLVGWENFPLRDALAAASGQTVVLESDANAAAIAEWKLGAARTTRFTSMAMMTLGTGVGSGLILDGKVWQGRFGMGGEVGHATVEPTGWLCGCGSRGCLETYASATGLVRLAREAVLAGKGSAALSALAGQAGGFTSLDVAALAVYDDSARHVFERLGFYLGIGIANLINTLDLPLIVVGGGLASSWKLFSPAMFRAVREYSVVYRLAEPTQFDTCEPDPHLHLPCRSGPFGRLVGRRPPAASCGAGAAGHERSACPGDGSMKLVRTFLILVLSVACAARVRRDQASFPALRSCGPATRWPHSRLGHGGSRDTHCGSLPSADDLHRDRRAGQVEPVPEARERRWTVHPHTKRRWCGQGCAGFTRR